MRRWHSEVSHMQRQMRLEREKHGVQPDERDGNICHCLLGIGFVRKRKPYDCGNPRCGLCHSEKWDRRRQNERERAIRFELEAS